MFEKTKKRITYISNYFFCKYEWLISLLLKLSFVKVDKECYILKTVRAVYGKNSQLLVFKALHSSLADVLTHQQQERLYRRMMWKYGLVVFCMSFLFTLVPDGIYFAIVSGALDLVFFQCLLFIAMQKILLLYGRDCDLEKEETKSVETIISIDSSGLMVGKYPILQKMKSVLGWLGKQIVKKIGPRLVTKASRSAFLIIRRQAVKWTSMVVAQEHVDFVFSAVVPFTCAIISGLVSTVIFVPMCNKLRRHLIEESSQQAFLSDDHSNIL